MGLIVERTYFLHIHYFCLVFRLLPAETWFPIDLIFNNAHKFSYFRLYIILSQWVSDLSVTLQQVEKLLLSLFLLQFLLVNIQQ